MIEVTKDELLKAKRAVLVMADFTKLALSMAGKNEPIEVMEDRLVLIKLLKKLEVVAK